MTNEKRIDLPANMFPITIRILSQSGIELWTRTLEKPDDYHTLKIPGYAGTEHYPVRVRVEYADGSTDETGMNR